MDRHQIVKVLFEFQEAEVPEEPSEPLDDNSVDGTNKPKPPDDVAAATATKP